MTSFSPSSKRSDYADPPRGRGQHSQSAGFATRHNPALGIMTQFVQLRPIPIYGLEIGFLRRDLDEVVRGRIERHLATDPDVSLRRRDDSFDVRQDLGPSRKRGGIGGHGKPIALIDVKDGEPLEEADAAGILPRCARLLLLGLGDEGVGVDDHRPLLALAHTSTKSERLLEGEPAL